MNKRRLGALEVPAIGFGCMVLPGFYLPGSEDQAIATLRLEAEIGANPLDTADAYGNGWVGFELSNDNPPWPAGEYRVEILVDHAVVGSVSFRVT